jgi:DNA polymerase-3 subunit delta
MKKTLRKTDDIIVDPMFPLYILDGDEYYIKKESVKKIKNVVLGNNNSPFSYQEILPENYEDEKTLETHICQASFFSKRVILINYFDDFSAKSKEGILKVLNSGRWVSKTVDIVVILLSTNKIQTPPQKKWVPEFKKLLEKKYAAYYIAYKLSERDTTQWVLNYLRSNKKKISPDIVPYIIEGTDGTLATIRSELDKLILYTNDKDYIELADINEGVGDFKIISLFDFCDAALFGRKDNALKYLTRIINESASNWDMTLLTRLWWTYKRNLSVKKVMEKTNNEKDIAASFQAPFNKKREIVTSVRKLTQKYFKKQLSLLFTLELKLKGEVTTQSLKKFYFEEFIENLPVLFH